MNDKDIERILGKMTNVYNDYLPTDSSFVRLLKVYGKLFEFVAMQLRRAKNSTFIAQTDTLYTLPYALLDASDGVYSVERALGLAGKTLNQQLADLEASGTFVQLSFSRNAARRPDVYSLRLKRSFQAANALVLYQDYYLRDNKIFLLPGFIRATQGQIANLHALDIQINDHQLERNWGSRFDLELGALLPRFEYRDVLRGFKRAYESDTTIKEIKEAIRAVTNWKSFNLFDMLSPTIPEAKKRLYTQFILSPSQFIVSVPEAIVYDKIRVGLLYHLLDQVKHPETAYVTFFDIAREDKQSFEDEATPSAILKPVENGEFDDEGAPKAILKFEDTIFDQGLPAKYDSGIHYDNKAQYDLAVISSYDQGTNFDESSFDTSLVIYSDFAHIVYREFPEIPRNFQGVATGTPGVYDFTVRTNDDGTAAFELYGSDQEDGTYQLRQTVANDSGVASVSVSEDSNVTGDRYYKIRAIAGMQASFLTLAIDSAAL